MKNRPELIPFSGRGGKKNKTMAGEKHRVAKKLAQDTYKLACPNEGGEVQKHGKTWERNILKNVYGATDDELDTILHTATMDLPGKLNRLDGVDVSIKTSGKNNVDMADIVRQYDETGSGKKYHVTVIRYNQLGGNKKLIQVVELDMTNSRLLHFGDLTRQEIVELDRLARSVHDKRKITMNEKTSMYALRDLMAKKAGVAKGRFHLMPSQRRTQLVMNLPTFMKENPDRVLHQSTTGIFRGGSVSESLESCARVFKKKFKPSTN
jgi:hypothetical protein